MIPEIIFTISSSPPLEPRNENTDRVAFCFCEAIHCSHWALECELPAEACGEKVRRRERGGLSGCALQPASCSVCAVCSPTRPFLARKNPPSTAAAAATTSACSLVWLQQRCDHRSRSSRWPKSTAEIRDYAKLMTMMVRVLFFCCLLYHGSTYTCTRRYTFVDHAGNGTRVLG